LDKTLKLASYKTVSFLKAKGGTTAYRLFISYAN